MGKKPTLHRVARLAQVSPATVRAEARHIPQLKHEHSNVPDETSVASIHDTDAPLFHLALTSVKEFPEELGRQRAEFALNRLRSPSRPPQHVTIPPRLQIRLSVASQAEQKHAV